MASLALLPLLIYYQGTPQAKRSMQGAVNKMPIESRAEQHTSSMLGGGNEVDSYATPLRRSFFTSTMSTSVLHPCRLAAGSARCRSECAHGRLSLRPVRYRPMMFDGGGRLFGVSCGVVCKKDLNLNCPPKAHHSFLFELHRIGFVIWSQILLITKTPILSFTCFAANKPFLVCPKNNLVSLTGGWIIGTFAYFPAWLKCCAPKAQ